MEQKGYFRTLTSLKGLFILIIAVHNTLAITPLFSDIPGTAFLILFGGKLGNSMFFILSGFLLSMGYKDRIQTHAIPFRTYLLRRLKKMYPMYILSNAAALVIEIVRYGVSAINVENLVFTLLLVRAPYNRPTWFLCALFVCYILFFGISYFAKSSTHYLIYITVGIITGYTLIDADLDLLFLSSSNGIAFMNFFLGCVLAEVYPLLSGKLRRWLQPLFLVLLPLLTFLLLAYGVEIIAGNVDVCFAFALCPMVLYLALADGPCSRILGFKGFVALGEISSSVFFWHFVLYFAFCDVYALVTQGGTIQEPQYILYFVSMLVLSAGFKKLEDRKRTALKNPIS